MRKLKLKAVIERVQHGVSVEELFQKLTDSGSHPGTLLYESQDEHGKFMGFSIGVCGAQVILSGKGDHFSITGSSHFIEAIVSRLPREAEVMKTASSIEGTLKADLTRISLSERLQAVNHMAIVRAALFDLEIAEVFAHLPIGVYGGFAYDFVRQFEAVPFAAQDLLQEDDYRFYLPSHLFIVDHTHQETYFIVLIPEAASSAQANATIHTMKEAMARQQIAKGSVTLGPWISDTTEADYKIGVMQCKKHIDAGDIFQVQYGRSLIADFSGDTFAVYQHLKTLNPSPFMFYMRDPHGVLLCASPELAISVSKTINSERRVVITPIAGTKPRGFVGQQPDAHLDERYAIALQTDTKELAEHVMLIDLARNDIASIAKPGTTQVDAALTLKKYKHVQHLVSRVSGLLRDDIDACSAYLATMNMGTLTGAPKPKAMDIIARYEKTERGFYGGGFGFITYQDEMEMTIIIRAMRIKSGRVFLRAAAGIVADSVPESEWQETENKMRSCRVALEKGAS